MSKLFWCIAIPAVFTFFYWIYYYFFEKIPVEDNEATLSNMALQDYMDLLREIDKIKYPEEIHGMEDEILRFEKFYSNKIPSNLNLFFTGRLYDHLIRQKNDSKIQ